MNKWKQARLTNTKAVIYTIDGITKTRAQWLLDYKVPSHLITGRMKVGMTFEEALKKPQREKIRAF